MILDRKQCTRHRKLCVANAAVSAAYINERLPWILCTVNDSNVGAQICSTSKYRGVHWDSRAKRWKARAHKDGKAYHIGSYKMGLEAAMAVNVVNIVLHGPDAALNKGWSICFPPPKKL